MTENDRKKTRMHVPPSSGDCGQGLDRALPATVSERSCFRWQHPEVIENANRHEPQRLIDSANGSKANRADGRRHKRGSGSMRVHEHHRACHSLLSHSVASEPPVKASLRLVCSLRSQRSALTGPGSDAGPISGRRERQAWSFGHGTPTPTALDTNRPSHGSPWRAVPRIGVAASG